MVVMVLVFTIFCHWFFLKSVNIEANGGRFVIWQLDLSDFGWGKLCSYYISYLTTKKIYIDNYLEFSRKLEDITDEKFVKFNRYDYLNIRNYDSIKESKGKEKERSFVIQKETYLSIAKLKKLNK